MFLELAEGEYNAPPMYYMSEKRKRSTYVKRYNRSSNVVPGHYRTLSEEAGVEDNPYIFIPDFTGMTAGYMVREDNFDDLTNQEWNALMVEVSPYQPQVQQGMSEDMFLADRAARKEKRQAKLDAKIAKKDAKTAIKNARAEKKLINANKEGGGGGGGLLTAISTGLGGVLSGMLGITPANGQTPGGAAPGEQTPAANFWDDQTFGLSNKIVVPAGAALVGGAIYLLTRKRKRRK